MDKVETHRSFFAKLITASAGASPSAQRVAAAFSSVPRENFVGPGPWQIFTAAGLIPTPSDDPVFLYQDVTVALAPDKHINNGQPALHAISLSALNPQPGEHVLHVGAGTGYYSAIIATLVAPSGSVAAYEIEPDLADRAARNLAPYANAAVHSRSGTIPPLAECDVIYVSAGATGPLDIWLDALRPNGRLLFPMTPSDGPGGTPGAGAMLLLTKTSPDRFHARFVSPAMFINCAGARDEDTAQNLSAAFKRGDARNVRSLFRHSTPDATAWVAGPTWWLSTAEVSAAPR